MRNYIQTGDTLPVPAPAAVVSGGLVVVGALAGVASGSAAAGEVVEIKRTGVFDLPKVKAQAWTVGAVLYASSTGLATTDAGSGNVRIGLAAAAADNPSDTGRVLMNG